MKLHTLLLLPIVVSSLTLPAAPAAPKKGKRSYSNATPIVTQSADQLAAVLRSNADRKAKADACRELAVIGSSKALPVLVPLLADPELHHMARYAMETMPGKDVDAAMRDQLGTLKGLHLVGIVGSLGIRGDAKAVKPLSSLLTSADSQVAAAAAGALGQIGTSDALRALLGALPGASGPAVQAAMVEGCLRAMEKLGAKGSTRQTRDACDQLRRMTTLPIHLRAAAERGAILAAGKKAQILTEALHGADWQFTAAIGASLESSTPATVTALIEALPQLPVEKQMVVIQTLGEIQAPAAVAPLAALARQEGTLQAPAVKALGRIATPGVVPVLVELALSSQAQAAQLSRGALAGLSIPAADDAVRKLLRNGSSAERLLGLELAARRRLTSTLPEMIELARTSPDSKIRVGAFHRISELGGAKEGAILAKMLSQTSNTDELGALADAITRICQTQKSPALTAEVLAAFSQARPAQKVALFPVLQAISGDPALGSVRIALADPDATVSEAARSTLMDWPDLAAAPDLLAMASNASERPQRLAALRGYLRLVREASIPPAKRLQMLRDAAAVDAGKPGQTLLLSALGDVHSLDALKMVMEKLKDPELSEEAAAAAVCIAEKLEGSAKAEAKSSLEIVAQTAKSPAVIERAKALIP